MLVLSLICLIVLFAIYFIAGIIDGIDGAVLFAFVCLAIPIATIINILLQ